MATIALVTVLYKSEDVLDGFLKSLSNQNYQDFHLYIIDNSPSQEGKAILDDLLSNYNITNSTYLANSENVGVATGNNQGIALSRKNGSTYTLLLNNDIEFDRNDLLSQMVARAKKDNEYLVIPKIFFFNSEKIWMAGGNFNQYRATIHHWGEGETDNDRYNSEYHCEYAPTCFMLIDNSVFDTIGIMDEKYFVYYDDTDFLYRAHLAGYKIKYLPSLHIGHKVSSSTGGNESAFTIYYANRNRIYFIRKNYRAFKYVIAISFTLLTRIIKFLRYNSLYRSKLTQAIVDGFKL